jgi:hypothetical protein
MGVTYKSVMDIERAIASLRREHLMISEAIKLLEYVLLDPSTILKHDRPSLVAKPARTRLGLTADIRLPRAMSHGAD